MKWALSQVGGTVNLLIAPINRPTVILVMFIVLLEKEKSIYGTGVAI